MLLKKPPLVEVWMSFRFDLMANAPPWSEERYRIFFDQIAGEFPNSEQAERRGIQVEKSRSGKKAKVTELVPQILATRAMTENGLRVVQLSPDRLVLNYLKADTEPYPGFQPLLDEAMLHFRRYVNCYNPIGVLEVAIHYVDSIVIPVPDDKVLKREDYFTLDFRVPEDVFGSFVAFEIKAVVQPRGGKKPVQLLFATVPLRSGDHHRKFRLAWHSSTSSAGRIDADATRANMQAAHDRLKKCFRHAFTDKGWALFEPEES